MGRHETFRRRLDPIDLIQCPMRISPKLISRNFLYVEFHQKCDVRIHSHVAPCVKARGHAFVCEGQKWTEDGNVYTQRDVDTKFPGVIFLI